MLEVAHICVAYGQKQVVNDVSFSVAPGEAVSIVGESGSGKSTVLRSIVGLMGPEGRVVGGKILFEGTNLLDLNPQQQCAYRGAVIATVYQQAGRSMDPITKIGKQFHEALCTKSKISRRESDERAIECMRALSLKEPAQILQRYPAMLSGGTNQRVALAMAMVMQPKLILADEPTSELDVTVQVEVVGAMQQLRRQCDAAILMVTHNIGVVAQMSDHVGVMYRGNLLEWGRTDDILREPCHPYTQMLMASVLRMDGTVPEVKTVYRSDAPSGCCYYARCPKACEACRTHAPAPVATAQGHMVMCQRSGKGVQV